LVIVRGGEDEGLDWGILGGVWRGRREGEKERR